MKVDIKYFMDFSSIERTRKKSLVILKDNITYLAGKLPSGSTREGKYLKVDINKEWTIGFWTGLMALAYEMTRDDDFKKEFSRVLDSLVDRLRDESRIQTHDLGFLYVLSFVPAIRTFEMKGIHNLFVEAAEKLSRRFHEKPGYLQAWKSLDDPEEKKRTIIDSMMNLPLLYMTWKISGEGYFKKIAIQHARTCMKYLVREDYSTYHTYLFNPETGDPIGPKTVQGYSDDSYWARGQAWTIYGFTLSYLYTGEKDFLETAIGAADFFISRLTSDFVPMWDMVFDKTSSEEKDSSAASIAASALLELSHYVEEKLSAFYQSVAATIIISLTDNYFNRGAKSGGPLLLHGVHAKPLGMGVDEGTIWGDYFYLEALMRLFNPEWKPYWMW